MKYFSIAELTNSARATKDGINNTPTNENIINMTELIINCLDPLREAYGKPIRVNSGFRSPALNTAVGGSRTSDHMQGSAAEITGGSPAENKKIFEIAKKLPKGFDQLIDEKNFSWIHISWRPKGNRNMVMKK